jgi:PAS domain S-box-containing protein
MLTGGKAAVDEFDRRATQRTSELREMIDTIPALAWAAHPDGSAEFFNRRWLDYTGLTSEQALGWGWQAAIHRDDLEGLAGKWRSSLASGAPVEAEARMRRFDGQDRWFLFRAEPLRNEAGEIVKWYGTNTDIEEKRRIEEALRTSERNARLIVDSIPGQVVRLTASGEVEAANPQVLTYFGMDLEGIKNWTTKGLVHPDDLPGAMKIARHSFETGEPYEMVIRVRRFDGAYRWFQSRGVPLRDANGRIIRWYALHTDIHDEKLLEQQLRDLINAIPGYVHTMRADGTVEFVNQRILDFFRKTTEELSDWEPTVHPEDRETVVTQWRASLATGEPFDQIHRVRRSDGEWRWFHSRGLPLRDESGQIIRWCNLLVDIDEQKKTEEALRGSQRDLSVIIETMPGLVWCASPDGELSYVNRRILDYLGVENNNLLSGGWARFLHPDDVASVVAEWSHSVASGDAFQVQTRLRRADGAYRWFHSLSQLGRDTEGNPARWYGVMIDIDDRKRAEEKVEQAYLRLAEAQQLSKTGSFITDLLADDHNWSEEAFRIFEFDPATTVTVNMIRDMVHPEDLQSFDDVISRGLTGKDVDFVFRIVTRRGSLKHIRGMARVMEQVEGRPLFIGALQDVTQSKVEEEQVRRSEAFLAEAQRLTRIGSFSWQIESNEIRWSDELYRIFEFEPGVRVTLDLIGGRVHPEDLPLLGDMIEKAQSAASHFAYEHRIVMPDHSIKHLHLTAHSRRDPEGRFEYIGAVQDVTQRHLAEASLARARAELANAAKISSLGVLTASIAHEVNQPLSGILTNASTCLRMLESDSPNIDGVRATARRTLRDGKRASDVISRLRALFSKKEFARGPVDLDEAAREVIALSLTDLERNRVTLRTEFTEDLPLAHGDRIQLQQVISNLVRNASKAMSAVHDRPRLLRIATRPHSDDQVCLSVTDAGVGLDSEGMDRLFQPFYTTKSNGMGIGLSVSRSIIESHQGRLWATPNEGPGATFSFSLPAIREGVTE